MRKVFILISFLMFFCFSCASIQDIEKKKAEGDAIIETFNHPWEKVFDGIKFVIRHSENNLINMVYRSTVTDFNKDDKTIIVNYISMGTIDMGIFLEPLDNSKTKVYFVKGAFTGSLLRETRIKTIIEETHYFLAHGEEAYRKYTHEKEAKRQTETLKE
ncbi:MAG: hypothetical protein LLF28_05495 [Nitrospiraceae bacterium]|nr:hypothetical protein [Nitrospiraceae bacterium]